MAYDWLPPVLERESFDSDEAFIDAVFAIFQRDFIDTKQGFNGLPIHIKRHPVHDRPPLFAGKNGTFRHLLTEGPDEVDRETAWDRCERFGWVLPILQHANTADVRVWRNSRNTNGAANVLALSDFSYKVVLTERRGPDGPFLLLWTAFPIWFDHQRRKLQKECEAYLKAQKS